jgi:hypothetical protein
MRATDAAEVMARMLGERGVSLESTEVTTRFGPGSAALVAWECFKRLAGEVASDGVTFDGRTVAVGLDMLLYETGIGPALPETGWVDPNVPPPPDAFHLSFARQFTFEDTAGEYEGMNEFALSFEGPIDAEISGLRDEQGWGEAGVASAEWVEAVERSGPFKRFVATGRVTRFVLDQGDM